MVVDLPRTDPEGWDADRMPEVPIAQTVVWETHVGDFSNDPAGGFPESHRGKYLAFTDLGTTLGGHPDFPTGLTYLKKLGITAVQLMPIYDFGSVDETICSRYNWGYDPVNYNVPEGSYSTNPYDGSVRIREVKQMVQALHNAGIKVIMDVVYNHMFSPDNWFERIVPEYFLRRKPNGALSNGSGCGCDMATERAMFRRFVVESVAYWAREYHLDGFRFDLMGLIDVDTMNAVRAALDEIPDRGPSILMYGEPWSASATAALPGTVLADKAGLPQLDNRIGHFCDTTRDAIKGHVFFSDRPGYVNGGMHENAASVRDAVNAWRASKQPEGVAGQVIQYVSAHDDLTLWDKLCASLAAKSLGSAVSEGDNENSVDVPKALYDADLSEAGLASAGSAIAGAMATVMDANRMAAGIVLTSAGIPFMLSGEEFARTKYGNSDSYDSARELNWLDWTRAWRMRDLVEYYTKLIALRKSSAEWFDGDRVIVSVEGDELVIRRRLEHGIETVACRMPLVMTVNGSAAECRPRHAKLVMKYKYAITPSECQQDEVGCYADLRAQRPYLNITEWNVADVDADDRQLGLSGSPTKVKKIENVVFAAKEAKKLTASDQDIDSLMQELIASHTLG